MHLNYYYLLFSDVVLRRIISYNLISSYLLFHILCLIILYLLVRIAYIYIILALVFSHLVNHIAYFL